MLRVDSLNAFYGDLQAVRNVNLEVKSGEIVALLGANAAGKSTTVKSISGIIEKMKGEIYFQEEKISNIPAFERVEMGLVQVPEGRKLFPFLSVRENLEMGAYTKKARLHVKENLEKVFTLFPKLKEREKQLAGTMSGGEQQMCAIARGLMTMPKLIMLDEPTLGLAPLLVKQIFVTIQDLRQMGMTVLLVEQNVRQSLQIADRVYMLSNGKILTSGQSEKLLNSDEIRQGYLGI
ncbi:ABC transporter ATP-binding protein [Fictibacillus sp. FJAT-27399]|uniref:ABC transporter ATP-binding protein n=1 Tax=Fictibacillus sp. FJAT-27399 TaxID=1729689 RepID=UPI000785648F|nr:ABC transporter ATP-binding protein [Fictibacillus sp. FJAT-27399]